MPGARCPHGLVCKIVRRNAHEHTGSAEALRHSLRNGFTAYAALSPATNSSCHRRRRIEGLVAPGWARKTSADLTPATGARTTRFCRTRWRRRPALTISLTGQTRPAIPFRADAAASTASHRAFRDDRDPPLFSGETGRVKSLICPTAQAEYFRRRDWTGFVDLPVVQSAFYPWVGITVTQLPHRVIAGHSSGQS